MMKSYRTAKSTEGLRLPHSPVVLGILAKSLRLKESGHPQYKSAQRYFSGKRIKPEVVEQVLVALVDAAVPKGVALPEDQLGRPLDLHGLVLDGLRSYSARWDHFVADLNAVLFPVTTPADLPVPVLRLIALDLGIRYGAWIALRECVDGSAPAVQPEGFPDSYFAAFLAGRLASQPLTREEFAKRVGVSTQTLAAWQRGGRKNLPQDTKISQLARALTPTAAGRATMELRLRVMVALQDIYDQLAHYCGTDRVRDMFEAMLLTAAHVHEWLVYSLRSDEVPSFDLREIAEWRAQKEEVRSRMPQTCWTIILQGAACPIGRMLCEVLGGVSSHQPDVAADFAVLPGDWTDRCRYWMQVLGSVEGGIKHFKQHVQETNEFPPGFVNEFVRFIPKLIDHSLRMADFDRLPGPDMQVFRVEDLPPEGKVANRVLQAERARSMGDFVTAVEHLRCAIQHVPSDAGVHFKLGAILGEKGALTGDMAAMEEALLELRVAVELDPDFGNARNEIGIVLSNMRRHEDAEAAFAEAEPYHGEHAHHWFTRGNNYIALKQYEAASAALEKAIELSKNHEHVEAQTMLSATLMALGQTRDARRIAKHVKHRVGFDPAEAWRQVLGIWDIRVPVVS